MGGFCFVGFGDFSAVCVLVVVSRYESVLAVGYFALLVFLVLNFKMKFPCEFFIWIKNFEIQNYTCFCVFF